MVTTLDESQVTYRVPLELVTRVNGSYNDGGTSLTNLIQYPGSSVVEQWLDKPLAASSTLAPGTSFSSK